jgi:hypothetical protein
MCWIRVLKFVPCQLHLYGLLVGFIYSKSASEFQGERTRAKFKQLNCKEGEQTVWPGPHETPLSNVVTCQNGVTLHFTDAPFAAPLSPPTPLTKSHPTLFIMHSVTTPFRPSRSLQAVVVTPNKPFLIGFCPPSKLPDPTPLPLLPRPCSPLVHSTSSCSCQTSPSWQARCICP